MQVAIKRVADVLNSPDQAKRALREICILRRMRHPNIIGLRDAFSKPSSTGAARSLHGRGVVQTCNPCVHPVASCHRSFMRSNLSKQH